MLKLYASGDGALHFNKSVTVDEAIAHLAGSDDAEDLRKNGWRIIILNTLPVAIAPIRRIDDRTLEIKGMVVTYNAVQCEFHEGWVLDSTLTVVFRPDGFDEDMEVKNWSIRAQVRHFLKYEKEITAQPWVKVPFMFAGEGI